MAGLAPVDAEGFVAVVASPARFPLLHLRHGRRRVVPGGENRVVARGALHALQVIGVAEVHRACLFDLVGDVFHLVASGALRDGECMLAVVALAARFPLLHVRHGGLDFRGVRVFVAAFAGRFSPLGVFHLQMGRVAEDHLARPVSLVHYVLQLQCHRPGCCQCQCGQHGECGSASHGLSLPVCGLMYRTAVSRADCFQRGPIASRVPEYPMVSRDAVSVWKDGPFADGRTEGQRPGGGRCIATLYTPSAFSCGSGGGWGRARRCQ